MLRTRRSERRCAGGAGTDRPQTTAARDRQVRGGGDGGDVGTRSKRLGQPVVHRLRGAVHRHGEETIAIEAERHARFGGKRADEQARRDEEHDRERGLERDEDVLDGAARSADQGRCRREAARDRRHRRERRRHRECAPVGGDAGRARHVERREREQRPREPDRERTADRRAGYDKHRRFAQQLADDASRAGAERDTDVDLAPAARRFPEEQRRQVAACDDEHQARAGEERIQPCAHAARFGVLPGQDPGVVLRGIPLAADHAGDVHLRALERWPRPQPCQDLVVLRVLRHVAGPRSQGRPDRIARARGRERRQALEPERRRQDADDDERAIVEHHGPPHYREVGAEPRGPDPMREHRERRSAGPLFPRQEPASDRRPHAEQRKQ